MIFRILLLFAYILIQSPAWAVGFGSTELKSHLGEPLFATVPLILSNEEKEAKLEVTLATPKEYQILEQNLPQSYLILDAKIISGDGQPRVEISSAQAMDESFLTIILKVQRGRGNFYKQVQIFLDPIWNKPNPPSLVTSDKKGQLRDVKVPFTVPPVASAIPMGSRPQALFSSSDWARRTSYGPVQSGDNISEIAYRLRKDKRFSNHQVMLALFDANPPAFEKNDINRLKKGAYLQVPSLESVQRFFQSQRFQDLKAELKKKKKAVKSTQKQKKTVVKAQVKSRFSGRVALGMTESLDAQPRVDTAISDAVVLKRLEKLEPLYDQIMASNIRIDGIGGKVDDLAQEVHALRDKVDALAKSGFSSQKTSGTSYGWWWFLLLLVMNILLLLFFLYRKQRISWEEKLGKAQHKHVYTEPEAKEEVVLDDVDDDEPLMFEANERVEEQGYSGLHPMDEPVQISSSAVSEISVDDEKNEKIHVDHVTLFEEATFKKDWARAEKHYQALSKNVQDQPRIQVEYIQMLHHEKRIIDRNLALLNLNRSYDKVRWNRFCSLFDDVIWHQLQEERVISFTGEVLEKGVQRSNLAAEEMKDILTISDLDVESTLSQQPSFLNEEANQAQSDEMNDELMDKTVIMDAKALAKWKSNLEEKELESHFQLPINLLDEKDHEKWGEVEPVVNEDLALEVDFDIGDDFTEIVTEPEEISFTDVDLEFTGEIEPLDNTFIRDDEDTKNAKKALLQRLKDAGELEALGLDPSGIEKKE